MTGAKIGGTFPCPATCHKYKRSTPCKIAPGIVILLKTGNSNFSSNAMPVRGMSVKCNELPVAVAGNKAR